MITEDYVSFETAKLLKEKGFDWNTDKQFNLDKIVGDYNITDRSRHPERYLDTPTLQMAMKWLREKHNLYVTSVPNGIGEYVFYPWVYKKFEWGWNVLESSLNGFQNTEFSSPEEACEAAIKYCLENLI